MKQCDERDKLFFEKRVVMRYLRGVIDEKTLLDLHRVVETLANRIDKIEEESVIVSTFYEQFLAEKECYNEKSLKLVELATYIHDNNIRSDELDVISTFVKKLKCNYNVSRGNAKTTHIDAMMMISMGVFKKTYKIFSEKREHEKEALER